MVQVLFVKASTVFNLSMVLELCNVACECGPSVAEIWNELIDFLSAGKASLKAGEQLLC